MGSNEKVLLSLLVQCLSITCCLTDGHRPVSCCLSFLCWHHSGSYLTLTEGLLSCYSCGNSATGTVYPILVSH